MTWIFDTCPDQFGQCIRQYVTFGVSLIVLILALYSCFKTYRTQFKITFELLPLIINSITSLAIVGLYSQMQIFNTRLVLLVIEVYSYFILCYGFVFMVIKSKTSASSKLKQMKCLFVGVSVLCLLAVVVLIILTTLDVLQCQQDQGAGSFIIIIFQIPLLLLTFVYSSKSKAIIRQTIQQKKPNYKPSITTTQHLINQEDQYIKLKIMQLNLVRFAFIVTFVLHIIELMCYYIGDQQIICATQSKKMQVNNALELYILTVENMSELFPHFIIPFIFWYLPAKIVSKSSNTIFISQRNISEYSSPDSYRKLKINKENSNLVEDVQNQEMIREKMSPKRHPHRLQTF